MENQIYSIISETEKAIKVKYPYYELTDSYSKKHLQKYTTQWVPKSQVKNIENIISDKIKAQINLVPVCLRRTVGFYMGIAPVKVEIVPIYEPDYGDKMVAHYKAWKEKTIKLFGYEIKGIYNLKDKPSLDLKSCYSKIDGKHHNVYDELVELARTIPVIKIKQYQ